MVTAIDMRRGAPIFTLDRHKLGVVKELREGRFRVDARWRSDYWLPTSAVRHTSAGAVEVEFPKASLKHVKLADLPPSDERFDYEDHRLI